MGRSERCSLHDAQRRFSAPAGIRIASDERRGQGGSGVFGVQVRPYGRGLANTRLTNRIDERTSCADASRKRCGITYLGRTDRGHHPGHCATLVARSRQSVFAACRRGTHVCGSQADCRAFYRSPQADPDRGCCRPRADAGGHVCRTTTRPGAQSSQEAHFSSPGEESEAPTLHHCRCPVWRQSEAPRAGKRASTNGPSQEASAAGAPREAPSNAEANGTA